MSLLAEYNSSTLHGFTLGYKTFFSQFQEKHWPGGGGYYPTPNSFYWNDKLLFYKYGSYTSELEFVNEQLRWIQTEEVQKQAKTQGRILKEECQKRINFFVLKLHETVGQGYDGKAHFTLRDIRNAAFLCLKS
jgi:hypothetical protein